MMTTTVSFPKELWKRTKIEALKRDIPAQEFVWDALRLLLKQVEGQQ